MFAAAPAASPSNQHLTDMPFLDNTVRTVSSLASLLAFVVGLIHLWFSFKDDNSGGVRWSRDDGFFQEHNIGWQKDFELTPQAIVEHWQPLVIGWISLGHHMTYSRTALVAYSTYLQMCLWYVFVAAFGVFGYAGNFGIIVGSLELVVAGFALILAIFSGNREPQLVLF